MSLNEEKKDNEEVATEEKEVKEEQPAVEEKKPAEAETEKVPASEKEETPKGNANQPRSKKPPRPTECAGCAKPLQKKLWYYRNGAFYCTNKCYKRKIETERKEAAEKSAK